MNKSLIELDEYLDLHDFELVKKEFLDQIDSISKKYLNIFYANLSGTAEQELIDYRKKVNVPETTFSFEKDDSFEFPENPGKMWTLYLKKILDEVDLNYLLIDKSEYWVDLSIYNKFPKLKSMVSNLPFKNVSRIFFMFNKESVNSGIHFDHNMEDWRQEFIWFRMNEAKKFYLLENNNHTYIQGSSCWFDAKIKHGSESDGFAASLRVDGEFTKEFREKSFGKNSKRETVTDLDRWNWNTEKYEK